MATLSMVDAEVARWRGDVAPAAGSAAPRSPAVGLVHRGWSLLWQGDVHAAEETLGSLLSPAYLSDGTSSASVLLHGTANKPGGSADTRLIYGDYFVQEALMRLRQILRVALRCPSPR